MMNTPVLISVIIPVYNATDYLRECLESLARQTFASFEVICVDDGSTDSSTEIINDIYRQLNGEAAAAFQQELRTRLEPVLELIAKGCLYFPRKRDFYRYKECVIGDKVTYISRVYRYLVAGIKKLLSFSDGSRR